ncbi:MAG: glycosyltransferase, partial [Pseudomonadota bacterium]
IDLSIEGITSFTTAPLRLTTYMGLAIAGIAFVASIVYLGRTLLVGEEVRGFPTLFLTILILGGTQLVALGIIGEYLGRIFNEAKRRPLYLVESVRRSSDKESDA